MTSLAVSVMSVAPAADESSFDVLPLSRKMVEVKVSDPGRD